MEHSKTIESALSTSSVKTLARTEPSQVTIPKAVKKQARIPEVGVESPFANELWLNQLRTSLYSNETKGRVFETIRRVSLEEVQPAVTEDDRRAAVDSLVRFSLISKEHGCERVTLGIAVRLMDLMLRLRPFSRDDFVILANTCYHLATKVEEVYQVDADARIFTDKARGMGARHIVAMGDIILRALDYKLGGVDIVTAAHFAPLFLGAAGLPADNEEALWEEGYAVPPRAVMDHFMDASHYDDYFSCSRPSQVAAGALLLTHRVIGILPEWPSSLVSYTGYALPSVEQAASSLVRMCLFLHGISPRVKSEKDAPGRRLVAGYAALKVPCDPHGPKRRERRDVTVNVSKLVRGFLQLEATAQQHQQQ